jgi:hypothetical protein
VIPHRAGAHGTASGRRAPTAPRAVRAPGRPHSRSPAAPGGCVGLGAAGPRPGGVPPASGMSASGCPCQHSRADPGGAATRARAGSVSTVSGTSAFRAARVSVRALGRRGCVGGPAPQGSTRIASRSWQSALPHEGHLLVGRMMRGRGGAVPRACSAFAASRAPRRGCHMGTCSLGWASLDDAATNGSGSIRAVRLTGQPVRTGAGGVAPKAWLRKRPVSAITHRRAGAVKTFTTMPSPHLRRQESLVAEVPSVGQRAYGCCAPS